jgi:hypothetical protein
MEIIDIDVKDGRGTIPVAIKSSDARRIASFLDDCYKAFDELDEVKEELDDLKESLKENT